MVLEGEACLCHGFCAIGDFQEWTHQLKYQVHLTLIEHFLFV
jgi:hypothetical protein